MEIETLHTENSNEIESISFIDIKPFMKYILPRTVGVNNLNTFQGSLRNFLIMNNAPTNSISTSLNKTVLADENQNQQEQIELNEKLTTVIIDCIQFDAHNRLQQLEIEWLQRNANQNRSTIEKMFQSETSTAKELIENAQRAGADFRLKLNEALQTGDSNQKSYQQFLSKRAAVNREIFHFQRQKAEANGEIELLRARVQQLNDEIQFYTLKNGLLNARVSKLRYELDEDIFSTQVLQMELEVLSNEKITNEDVRASALDDARSSIDIGQIASIQPSNFFRDQLIHELRRVRGEYEKKLETYHEELHRRYELELHRYQMYKLRPIPNVNQEHQQKLQIYQREKRELDQQISVIRSKIQQVESNIELTKEQIAKQTADRQDISSGQTQLKLLQKRISEMELKWAKGIDHRNKMKQQIDLYRKQIDEYSNQKKEKQQVISTQYDEPVQDLHFDVDQDCEKLKKSFETNSLIDLLQILANRTVDQRLQIRQRYRTRYNKTLNDAIDIDMENNLKKLLKILLLSPTEHDCYETRRVLTMSNMDENILLQIFLDRTDRQIAMIKEIYQKLFQKDLAAEIREGRDSFPRRLVESILSEGRIASALGEPTVDAKYLYENNNKWLVDGSTLIELVIKRSNEHLQLVFDAYIEFDKIDIEQRIQREADFELSRSLMTLVRLIRNRSRFFAYELRKCLKGINTNEEALNRILVSRLEIDFVQIMNEFEKITRRTLFDQIQSNVTGNYQRFLLEFLHQNQRQVNKQSNFLHLPRPELVRSKSFASTEATLSESSNLNAETLSQQSFQTDRSRRANSLTRFRADRDDA